MTSWLIRVAAVAVLLALPGAGAARGPAKPSAWPAAAKPAPRATPKVRITPITCTAPVGRLDSAKALRRRFGEAALVRITPGDEGAQEFVVVLNPQDSARRIEVIYPDAAMRAPLRLRIDRLSSTWSVAGLRVGEGLAAVTARNGGGFALRGFGTGEGGRVTGWSGGALATLPGGCTLGVRFVAPQTEQVAAAANGSERNLRSDQAEVVAAEPIVAELSMGWAPAPPPARRRK